MGLLKDTAINATKQLMPFKNLPARQDRLIDKIKDRVGYNYELKKSQAHVLGRLWSKRMDETKGYGPFNSVAAAVDTLKGFKESDFEKPQWEKLKEESKIMQKIKDDAVQSDIAGSTPTVYPMSTEDIARASVTEQYNWRDDLKPLIENATIIDRSPKFNKDHTRVNLPRYRISVDKNDKQGVLSLGGTYFRGYDIIENTTMKQDPGTTAHEFLHQLFAKYKLPVNQKFGLFNELWNDYLDGNPDSELGQEMSKIDNILWNSSLYENLRGVEEPETTRDWANERFAYLGEEIGRKDADNGKYPEWLKGFYSPVFNFKKK